MMALSRSWTSGWLLIMMVTFVCVFSYGTSEALGTMTQVRSGSETMPTKDGKAFKRSEKVADTEWDILAEAMVRIHSTKKVSKTETPPITVSPKVTAKSYAYLDSNDTLANLTLFDKKFKSQIVIPLNEIIRNASDFIKILNNDQKSSGDGSNVELELAGSKEEMTAMRDDLKSQVDALQELSSNAEQLQIEGESLLIEVTKTEAELERRIGEAEKDMNETAQELSSTEALMVEHEKSLKDSEKEEVAAHAAAEKAQKDAEKARTECVRRRKRGFFDDIGAGFKAVGNAIEDTAKTAVNAIADTAETAAKEVEKGALEVAKGFCSTFRPDVLEKADLALKHAQNIHAERKVNLAKDKEQLDTLKSNKEELINSLEAIIAEKNATSKHMEKIKRKTSTVSQLQSKLKLRQKEISDLHVKLEALMKNVEIDMLRQGIEKVANIANDLKSDVKDEEDDDD